MELSALNSTRIPHHVAIVMDGNGRWAQRRGLPRTEGHAAGEEALMDTIWGAADAGIDWLTVYAFSTENWKRPTDEVRYLMGFNERLLLTRRDEIHARNIRMQFLGRRDWRVPRRILKRIDETVELTNRNTGMVVSMAFNYGGRAELVDAVREVVRSGVRADKVTEKTIAQHLYDPKMPEPELVIRTSGEVRTSNFLMWESAYSEWIFTDVLWPDFRRAHLYECIAEYQRRDRRFGGLGES
ncbi:MAG TPA: polyprenyl diphosphate synthase [Microthrixaceae bacterium]|nr:polyprenyl diphosphate synthase [Microthrixaceae bacterium]